MRRQKIKVVLFLLLLSAGIVTGLYYIARNSARNKKDRVRQVNENFECAKGIITRWSSYKSHIVEVMYVIDGKTYFYSGGWDTDLGLRTGDSIRLRYAKGIPEIVITEMEKEF